MKIFVRIRENVDATIYLVPCLIQSRESYFNVYNLRFNWIDKSNIENFRKLVVQQQ